MSGSGFDADLDQIGQQAADLLKGAVGIFAGKLQHFFGAGADAFVPFFEFFQQRRTLGETAMTVRASWAKSFWRAASWRRAAAKSSRAAATVGGAFIAVARPVLVDAGRARPSLA